MKFNCKPIVDHLSRVEGQLRALRRLIEEGESCDKVAQLVSATSRSFDSLKGKVLQGFFEEKFLPQKALTLKQKKDMEALMKMVKS